MTSLAEKQQAEEEEPEGAHGMPIPSCAVDDRLAQLQTMNEEE
jgi:hypothetical protein